MSSSTKPEQAWQREWQTAFRSVNELLEFLSLDPQNPPQALEWDPSFPIRVPRSYSERMRKGDWDDPLLRQVLPLRAEAEERPGFSSDAVGDGAAQERPGLLKKYHGRALLMLTGECAVHCRYCFRREFPYEDLPVASSEWNSIYTHLADDPNLEEIIFSGGDPLSLSNSKLRWHWERALALPQVRRIRIHTRVPVVIPSRLDAGFLSLSEEMHTRRPLFFVLHINHAEEINAELKNRIQDLRATGAVLLNQAVLLRGVNDTVDALANLSNQLLDAGVLPYYLHQLDRVKGAAHFEVSENAGLAVVEDLKKRLPGYAIPRYVRELPGEASKLEVTGLTE